MPESVKLPLFCLVKFPSVPLMTPANVVELVVPRVSVLLPRLTVLPATPLKSVIEVPEVVVEMSKVAPDAMVTPDEGIIEPLPERLSVPPLIVVRPV